MPAVARILRAGIVVALLVALAGWAIERSRFGATDDAAAARVQAQVQSRFDTTADTLRRVAEAAGRRRDLIALAPRDTASARALFDELRAALDGEDTGRTGVTVYDATGTPIAWAGRVSDLQRERLSGPVRLFVLAGGAGPRLVHVETIRLPASAATPLATIAVEQVLEAEGPATAILPETFVISMSIAPVTLNFDHPGPPPFSFVVRAADGTPLVNAAVTQASLAAARTRWREATTEWTLAVGGAMLVLIAGSLVERRRRARRIGGVLALSAGIAGSLLAARLVLWLATGEQPPRQPWCGPLELPLTALVLAALSWLAVDVIERRRVMRPRAPVVHGGGGAVGVIGAAYVMAGMAGAALIWVYERALRTIVASSNLDLLHFSLHPLSATRLSLAFALILLHAAAVWAVVAVIRMPGLWRRMRRGGLAVVAAAAWLIGAAAVVITAAGRTTLPVLPMFVALGIAGLGALAWARFRAQMRHASPTTRLGALLGALLLPSFALYPSLFAFGIQAKEGLVANRDAPQALTQRDDLQTHVRDTLEQIDAMPGLPALAAGPVDLDASATEAFVIWSQTDLAQYRLTSAVELYRADGRLASRFALRLPEYAARPYAASRCSWDITSDVSPIGTVAAHELRATRGICERGRVIGGIIVRALLDYRTLPFIASKTPDLSPERPDEGPAAEDVAGNDVEFAVYGWSRSPIFSSRSTVWPIPDPDFDRLAASREPFWTTIDEAGSRFRVYLFSDRGGIFALGYPVVTLLGHFFNLAELVTLVFVLYAALIVTATLFGALTSRTPSSGRALLHEVRSSFYLKLFLAFSAVAVIPVLVLAVAIRTYVANDLNAGVEDSAVKTVTVAQRLVEDYSTLQQRGAAGLQTLDDGIMGLVGRAIDEDVNLFAGAHLQATSERDLFASQLLSPRTPGDVYREIVVNRAPTYVGVQQDGSYLIAAAPVRSGDREEIVTVPIALRQQQIEQQIDELDRRVLFAAVLFTLLGGALGYWMAEHLADPVSRLSRATRRIARGEFDARIAATSADELGRLVTDFNRMADDLVRQRRELERTQRLEAWADMARQVAHDIKNPLTPIQLSAEHVRRVNLDRGAPLSPALDECVTAILAQVQLLRQLSAEFSSFASSPTPRPEPTDVAALLEEVLAPYRTGLGGRIAVALVAAPALPQVLLDRTLFSRAVTNIIENALHAMPGVGQLSVAVQLKPMPVLERDAARPGEAGRAPAHAERLIEVRISDTGVGMDQESLDRIFLPYFSTKATGTGLGLTIAKRNVELLGGTIQVASERGVGTTVTIAIPVGV